MLPTNIKFCWLALLILLSGCASHPDTRSIRHKQALEWAQQGEKAYLRGNVEQSRQYYEKALQFNITIENAHGIASNTLSLAQIHLDLGEYDLAGAKLQLVLDNRDNIFAADMRAEAAARYTQLALLLKQTDQAVGMAQQAQILCEVSRCAIEAAILNLQAQTAFVRGDLRRSAELAQQAAAKAGKQPTELANAWRLQAEIMLRGGVAADAVLLLEKALSLDKQLGLPKKIALDLHLLAEAKDMLGFREEAESCRSRERAIRIVLGPAAAGEKLP